MSPKLFFGKVFLTRLCARCHHSIEPPDTLPSIYLFVIPLSALTSPMQNLNNKHTLHDTAQGIEDCL